MGFIDKLKRVFKNETNDMDVLLKAFLQKDELTREKALMLPNVSSDVDFIASSIACMPVKLYKIDKKGKTEEVKSDTRIKLLNSGTGDTLNSFQFKKAIVEDYLLGKGGYAFIKKLGNTVQSLHYVKDTQVTIYKNTDPVFKSVEFEINGKRYKDYEIIRVLRNTKDGASGEGVVVEINKALETVYRMLLYQLNLVKNGGNKKGFLQSDKRLGQDEIDSLKEAWKKLYANNEDNIVILNNGLKFQESSNSSVEMQLSQNKKLLEDDIDKVFHIDKDFSLTFKKAILPVVKAFESALNDVLLLEKEKDKKFFMFDTHSITEATLKERYEAYKVAKETGFLTINEIRQDDNRNEIDGLDVVNMSLGSVLYDVKKKSYFTPNTGEVQSGSDDEIKEDDDEPDENNEEERGENGEQDEILQESGQ